jgi:hypothetical protein
VRPIIADIVLDEEIADQVAQQEDAEMEAMVSLMDDEVKDQSCQLFETPDTIYESDGEEYDHLFMSVIGGESEMGILSGQPKDKDSADEEMDIS